MNTPQPKAANATAKILLASCEMVIVVDFVSAFVFIVIFFLSPPCGGVRLKDVHGSLKSRFRFAHIPKNRLRFCFGGIRDCDTLGNLGA